MQRQALSDGMISGARRLGTDYDQNVKMLADHLKNQTRYVRGGSRRPSNWFRGDDNQSRAMQFATKTIPDATN